MIRRRHRGENLHYINVILVLVRLSKYLDTSSKLGLSINLSFQLEHIHRRKEEGRRRRVRREQCGRQFILPGADGRASELRPVVRAALPAAVGLPAATGALPASPAPLAAVSQLLLAVL